MLSSSYNLFPLLNERLEKKCHLVSRSMCSGMKLESYFQRCCGYSWLLLKTYVCRLTVTCLFRLFLPSACTSPLELCEDWYAVGNCLRLSLQFWVAYIVPIFKKIVKMKIWGEEKWDRKDAGFQAWQISTPQLLKNKTTTNQNKQK